MTTEPEPVARMRSRPIPALALALAAALSASSAGATTPRLRGATVERGIAASGAAQGRARIVVSEVLADPGAVADEQGEWIELYNAGDAPAELRGWRLASRGDPGHAIGHSLVVRPGAAVVLARSAAQARNGGVRADHSYGADLSLANSADWLVLRDTRGSTVDSVAWSSPPRRGASWALRTLDGAHAAAGGPAWTVSEASFGRGDRGTPGRVEGLEGPALAPDLAGLGAPHA